MSMLCATHPGASATGQCSVCGRPFCPTCVVEDIAAEISFCSSACQETLQRGPEPTSSRNAELIQGLESPIRTGWGLASRLAWPLTQWVGIPAGLLFSVLEFATAGLWVDPDTGNSLSVILNFIIVGAVAAPATAVVLSRAHATGQQGNPWPHVAPRFLPWLGTMICFGLATTAGSMAFIIPGIILGIRLFWADEFALVHGRGPISALRDSWELTRGLTGKVFGFQFVLGFAEYLVFIPIAVGFAGVALGLELLPPSVAAGVLSSVLSSVLLVIGYASAHAAEVVYFYGLRALRAEVPSENVTGDWVDEALRVHHGHAARGSTPSEATQCPTCGTRWDPADYRADAAQIFCSICRTELTRPT